MKAKFSRSLRMVGSACVLTGVLVAAVPAAAQSSQTQELINRLDRLQQEMNTLQRHVYRGEAPPAAAPPQVAVVPQGADGAAGSRSLLARLSVQISQLETENRRLTGQNEELMHSVRQLQERLDRLVADVDFRLSALEGGVAAPGGGEVPAGVPDTPVARGEAPPAPSGAPDQQIIGTLRADPATGLPLPPPAAAGGPAVPAQQAAVPAETPQQQYDRGLALILKDQDFGAAERVLRSFIDANPEHDLASNAYYWLGRTYFVREDFQQAAFTFAEGVQKFPKSNKAPDNLLNLGMSLARLGKEREACTAYARLEQNFPNAEDAVKSRVKREQARAKCR